MSQNKYMHPRNIYKNPPNFKELAILYPEFRNVAKQDITGKVIIDFKDQEALRVLTTTLLQKDFGLKVEIPSNRLIPTLPLRLNYLLWIEDLIQLTDSTNDVVRGVDIGTGASCIYPILAASTKKWKMLATELNMESINCANRNVACNGLKDLITVKQVGTGTILKGALDEFIVYDFTMCNPPFFSSEEEADSKRKSRSDKRTLPHNVKTGSLGEVVIQGGEVAFILQMIQESRQMKSLVRVYSTMVGHKSSLKVLKSEIEKAGATSITQTEFCQGYTTRWGLAWTFFPHLSLMTPSNMKKKIKPPMKYVLPMPTNPLIYTIEIVTNKIKSLFSKLQMECKDLKGKKHLSVMEVTAQKNTWTHQRRKRREQKIMQNLEKHVVCETVFPEQREMSANVENSCQDRSMTPDSPCKLMIGKRKSECISSNFGNNNNKRSKNGEEDILHYDHNVTKVGNFNEICPGLSDPATTSESQECEIEKRNDMNLQVHGETRNEFLQDSREESKDSNPAQNIHSTEGDQTDKNLNSCILKALVSVRKVDAEVHIEIAWLGGVCGRDAVHQVLQYVKNNLKLE